MPGRFDTARVNRSQMEAIARAAAARPFTVLEVLNPVRTPERVALTVSYDDTNRIRRITLDERGSYD